MVSVEEARKVLCREAYNVMPAVRKYVKSISKLIANSSNVDDVEEIVKKSSPVKNYIEAIIGPCDDT
jgi:hypothetical protein